jgi:hypothetical protein
LLWTVVLPDAQRHAKLATHQLKELPRSLDTSRSDVTNASQHDTFAEFEQHLASPEVVSHFMAQLWKQADQQGLLLNKVEYRKEADSAGRFNRLSITMPTVGTYPAVRQFTFALMADFPALSLDKLDMKRSQVTSGEVEATLHLTLLTQP